MKKLIAISVVFALVAGAAFAQVSIGGGFDVATRLASDSSVEGMAPKAGGTFMNNSHINVRFGGDEAGGLMRIYHRGQDGTNAGVGNNEVPFAFMWWKPIDQLRLQFGVNPDGDWGHAQITGWGYNAEAGNGVAVDEWAGSNQLYAAGARNLSFGILNGVRAFAPGFSALGAAITIRPLEDLDLAINLGIPLAFTDNNNNGWTYVSSVPEVKDVYSQSLLDVAFGFEGIGKLRVAAQFNGLDADDSLNPLNLNLAFHLTAISGMGAEIGVGYKLPDGDVSYPIGVGLGFSFADGDFSIKARVGVSFLGSNGDVADDTVIGIGLLPSYNITPNLVGYLNLGAGLCLPGDKHETYSKTDGKKVVTEDLQLDYYINPYIRVRAANGINFYAGAKVVAYSDDVYPDRVEWSIPILIRAYF